MIYLPASVRVYVCLAPTDMRCSFDGLYALVRLLHKTFSTVFVNR